jgi:hypothetical protein
MDPHGIGRSKAIREGYAPAPFFFRQEYQPHAKRWVAWTASLPDLRTLFYRVLGCFPEEVEVLLKLSPGDARVAEEGPWQRYYGACGRDAAADAVREHEELVFVDGGSQLCVRQAGEDDYLALDEHGIFFLYSDGDGFAALCRELGFEERAEELLYQGGHWHYRPGHPAERWQPFIRLLGLRAV